MVIIYQKKQQKKTPPPPKKPNFLFSFASNNQIKCKYHLKHTLKKIAFYQQT